MFPLDFEEFIQITNITDEILGNIRECYLKRIPVMEVIHEKMSELFLRYLLVGGMPEAVKAFERTSNLNDVMEIHRDIKELYKLDFTQYEAENKNEHKTNAYKQG